ncbi:hypothetical protein TetV_520 [Tetraselmis virus 1]|uniref:Uncharacterized protein n=1 Tax=Tetraselmis virus 1 TaxID=2060617 RepID=A0A2P0VNY8_9VIRU|nr:hypothetical protein QJ968_gp534 [Tetraselmis virus 1]AUF82602.1 hypothetical protein TetV_520 [Tetraselmis virus 1]
MPVNQVLLYVSANPTIPETATADVTAEWQYDGIITYNIGTPYALRYFWVKTIDDSSNESTHSLGSYRTQDNTAPVLNGSLAAGTPAESVVVFNYSISDASGQFGQSYVLLTTDNSAKSFSDITGSGQSVASNSTTYQFTGLVHSTTYYGWLAVSDAAGNESVFDGGNITTASDAAPPILTSHTFTATVGAEETSVDIALAINDPTVFTPGASNFDQFTIANQGAFNQTYDMTTTYGVVTGTGGSRTYETNAAYGTYKSTTTDNFVAWSVDNSSWEAFDPSGGFDIDTAIDNDSITVDSSATVESGTSTHDQKGKLIPSEASSDITYTAN